MYDRGQGVRKFTVTMLALGLAVGLAACSDDDDDGDSDGGFGPPQTAGLPTHDQLQAALTAAVGNPPGGNGGLNLNMWATVVDRSGIVVAVAYTGAREGDQWQGSRVISAQKANTANAFSLPTLALSTANLYTPTQPGGSLFGLQESNPVNTDVAYGGDVSTWGTVNDFMVGKRIGGVNVFGGGLALYDAQGNLLGALGVSGDTSCADHNIAWKTRFGLNLDNVPAGVAAGATNGTDNIIYDIDGGGVSASGFGHPTCSDASTAVGQDLPASFPVGPTP
jgi:uncharacterized protein GlcG (DUF336 family)